ncbi:MAG: hypothetical protein ACXVJ3_19710 [Ilumatobacteraceae bacterium]
MTLFVVAALLGSKTHGTGSPHPTVTIIRDVVFAWFLISVFTLIALVVVFLIQNVHRPPPHRRA